LSKYAPNETYIAKTYIAYKESVNYNQAKSKCEEKGMELTSIHDADSNNSVLKEANGKKCGSSWIGLQRNDSFKFTTWEDGSAVS